MAEIPQRLMVEVAIEDQKIDRVPRGYLGYSELADECPRKVWYNWRWAAFEQISKRAVRLFSRGHQEEPVIVGELRGIGVVCEKVLDDQDEVVGSFGHVKGHPDGYALNIPDAPKTWHLLEFKTANDKRFREFVRFGVKRSNPKYYGQIQMYMGHKKLTRCLFVVTCKSDDARHYERVEFDAAEFARLQELEVDLITASVPPAPMTTNPDWYACKWCQFHAICHLGERPAMNCRTCRHATVQLEGQWGCAKFPEAGAIPKDFQLTGCQQYEPLF